MQTRAVSLFKTPLKEMSQSKVLLSILCLVLAYSCAQVCNIGSKTEERRREEFPWLLSVWLRCDRFLGGGSLISKHAVLTAWKVIENQNVSQLAVINSSWDNFIEVRVRSVVRHPNFSQTTGAYNLAILFLKKTIEFTNNIAPINLATQTSIRNLDLTSCFFKGALEALKMPVVSTATCLRKLRLAGMGVSFRLDNSLMCAGISFTAVDCENDGYPLVCPLARDPSQFQLVGISNWHGDCSAPLVYTNVARLHGWINQQIQLNPYVDGPADEDNVNIMCYARVNLLLP